MHYTLDETKAAIKTVITTCAPLAVVFDWWCLEGGVRDGGHHKWPAALKSSLDLNAGGKERTHGYVIEFAEALPSFNERLGGSDTQRWAFSIFGLHYHKDRGASANHSSSLFLAEVMEISKAFRRTSDALIALPAAINQIDSFQFGHVVAPFGAETCHAIEAKLLLRPC